MFNYDLPKAIESAPLPKQSALVGIDHLQLNFPDIMQKNLVLVPSSHQLGTQLHQLNWPINQLFEKVIIKKGTQLNRKRYPARSSFLTGQNL